MLKFSRDGLLDVYRGGNNMYLKIKMAHGALTVFSIYSLVQAYRKNKKFRGLFLWLPLTLFFVTFYRRGIMRYNPIHSMHLFSDGKHIGLRSYQSLKAEKVPIREVRVTKGDALAKQLRTEIPAFIQMRILPVRIGQSYYALDMRGDVKEEMVLKSILNAKDIDTSKSFDPQTGRHLLVDI